MIKYTPASQLTLEGFSHPFDKELDRDNRWVKLAKLMPWDGLAGIYAQKLRSDSGRGSVDIRMVIGALIVKHKLGLSDRATVEQISENIYIQYFCGLQSFQAGFPFDPSLFVDIRKRMGPESFDAFNDLVIEKAESAKPARKRTIDKKKGNGPVKNKGTLKVDATVAGQQISYPTDLGLLNECRKQAERIIDTVWKGSGCRDKPRDYRRMAHKAYLEMAKKKKKTKRKLRKAIKQQLQYLERDIRILHRLLDGYEGRPFPLSKRDQRLFWAMQLICGQQRWMYQHKTNSHSHRIVSLYQPWVRPIPRGKDKARTEFGAKLGVSEVDGFSKINTISFEAYNESQDLKEQVESFQRGFGRYPKLLLGDQIYLNRENRAYLKERGIQIVGKPLGRPPKQQLSPYQKRKRKKQRNQRNHIEGKFGQGKNAYGLNNIRARRMDTSGAWIAAIFFVMNLTKLVQLAERGLFWLQTAAVYALYRCRMVIKSFVQANLLVCSPGQRLNHGFIARKKSVILR